MAISPFRNKYDSMAAYKNVTKVQLRCIKDGSLRMFLDDGPFPRTPDGKAVTDWQNRTPQSGRSALLNKMKQTESDPLASADDPDAVINLFVFDGVDSDGKPLPLPKIWDPKIGQPMSPVRMTDHHRAVMGVFCAQRNEISIRADEQRARLKEEADAKTNAGVDALLARLGDVVGKSAPRKSSGGAQ